MGRRVPAQAAPGILKRGKKTGLRAPCVDFWGVLPSSWEPHLGQPPGLQLPDEARGGESFNSLLINFPLGARTHQTCPGSARSGSTGCGALQGASRGCFRVF
uniref:Uncharacterized protein n=1 Tax=Anas zonorhyncha TaxID=75864 RepID=A0A8B9V9H6_9AVES